MTNDLDAKASLLFGATVNFAHKAPDLGNT
jgi:hypothetical protein